MGDGSGGDEGGVQRGRASGFVLRTWPLREADSIVSLFTLEHGKLRGVAHRARRPKSPWLGALEPMTELTLHWRGREGADLVSLSEPSIERSPYRRELDLARIWTLTHVAELVEAVATEEDADPILHRLCRSLVDALEAGTGPPIVARHAELWILRLQGVMPDLTRCAGCGASMGEGPADGFVWDWRLSGVACGRCTPSGGGGPVVLGEDLPFLEQLRRRPAATVEDPGPAVLRRTGVLLSRLLEELLGRELRTRRFLEQLER